MVRTMGRGKLTPEEIAIISASPWVASVKDDRIAWKDEFKEHFIREYEAGKEPMQIFAEAGFPKSLIGTKRIERAAANWREVYGVPVRQRPKSRLPKPDGR